MNFSCTHESSRVGSSQVELWLKWWLIASRLRIYTPWKLWRKHRRVFCVCLGIEGEDGGLCKKNRGENISTTKKNGIRFTSVFESLGTRPVPHSPPKKLKDLHLSSVFVYNWNIILLIKIMTTNLRRRRNALKVKIVPFFCFCYHWNSSWFDLQKKKGEAKRKAITQAVRDKKSFRFIEPILQWMKWMKNTSGVRVTWEISRVSPI